MNQSIYEQLELGSEGRKKKKTFFIHLFRKQPKFKLLSLDSIII